MTYIKDAIILPENQAKNIAEILNITLCKYGVFNDWNDIICDMIDDGDSKEKILKFAKQISDAVSFMNNYVDSTDQVINNFYEDAVEYIKDE